MPDSVSAPFWDAATDGVLRVQRCTSCRTYWHPPREYCLQCESTHLETEPVSGRGVVYSFTRTESGARHPYFQKQTPYVVGLVELVEQSGLVLVTNFPGAQLEDLVIGDAVEVVFEPDENGAVMPQFRLVQVPNTHEGTTT